MASPPLPDDPAPSLSNFQFKMIGRQPALLNRISVPTIFPADAQLTSPSSPLEDPGNRSTPEASGFNSAPLTRPSLLQALSSDADVPMSDSTVFSKGAQKVDISTHINANTGSSASKNPSEFNSSNHFRDGSSVTSDSPRLQYPASSNAEGQLHTPTRTPSPLSIKKELSSSKAFFPTPDSSNEGNSNVSPILPSIQPPSHSLPPQPHIAQPDQSVPATMSIAASLQASPSPFASLKNMHTRLMSSLSSLSQSAFDPSNAISSTHSMFCTVDPSVEQQERHLDSVSSTIATALSLTKHAHTLAQRSLSSAEEASKVASASLAAAKESFDTITMATNLVEEAASSIDDKVVEWGKKEEEWKEMTKELQVDLDKLGEWIKDREKDRARRMQLREQEAREKQAKEAAMASQKEASIETMKRTSTEIRNSIRPLVQVADVAVAQKSANTAALHSDKRQDDDNNRSKDEINAVFPPSPLGEYLRHEEETLRHLREVEAVAKRARENAEIMLEQRRRDEERRKRAEEEERQKAAEQERQRQIKEERRRIALQEEAERRRQAEEEEKRWRAAAEEAERLCLQAMEDERRRKAEEEGKRRKAAAEEAERHRLQAGEEERRCKAVEEQRRLDAAKAEATLRQELEARAEQERRRAEISEARKLDQHETALKIRADRARRAGSAASPGIEQDAPSVTTLPERTSRTSTPTFPSSVNLKPSGPVATSASPPAQVQIVVKQTLVPTPTPLAPGVKLGKKERKRAAKEQKQSEVVVSGGVRLSSNNSTSSPPENLASPTTNETQGPPASPALPTAILPTARNSQMNNNSLPRHPGTPSQLPNSADIPTTFSNTNGGADSAKIPNARLSTKSNISSDFHATKSQGLAGAGKKKLKGKPAPAYDIPIIKKEEKEEDASSILQEASDSSVTSSSKAQTSSHPAPAPVSHLPPAINTRSAGSSDGQSSVSVARDSASSAKPREEHPKSRKPSSAAVKAAPHLAQPLPARPVTSLAPVVTTPAPTVLTQVQPRPSAEEVRDRVLRYSPISPDIQGDGGGWNSVRNDDTPYQSASSQVLDEREPYSNVPSGRDTYPAQNSWRNRRIYDHYSPPRPHSPVYSRSPSPMANRSARVYGDNIRSRSPYSRSPPPPPRRRYSNLGSTARGDRYIPSPYSPPSPPYLRRNDRSPTPPPASSHLGMKRPRESDQNDLPAPPTHRPFNSGSDYNHAHASDWPASSYHPPRNSSSSPPHELHPLSLESRLERVNYDSPSGVLEQVSYDRTMQGAVGREDQQQRSAPSSNKQRQSWNARQQEGSSPGMRPGLLSRLGNAPQQQSPNNGGLAKPRGQAQRGQGRGRGRGGGSGLGDRSQQPRQLSQRLQSAGGSNPLLSRLDDVS